LVCKPLFIGSIPLAASKNFLLKTLAAAAAGAIIPGT
jgi:hypothetical protein